MEKTRWLSDQSTPVLDDGIYRRVLKQRLFERKPMFEAITPTGVIWSDGQHTEVDSLVFATGFRPNLKFLSGLECPGDEYWAHRNGQAKHLPGLYFVGLPKQRNFASATLRGVGQDTSPSNTSTAATSKRQRFLRAGGFVVTVGVGSRQGLSANPDSDIALF
ncbi:MULTISPECIES: hypothetical protein [unclassified Pseudomonas]|uniref:hypothetical protein n=1 Tax=unclassified Pseudomonas TaxID=196821 RepID=UPI0039B7466B